MRLGYLYSRYPVLSQTFCDMEMLELERQGFELTVGSIHPPLTSIRHPHAGRLQAQVHYAPPAPIVALWEEKIRGDGRWPGALVEAHDRKYRPTVKARTRARNAGYFAELFRRRGVEHFHVHFANRAAHTALFLKAMAGIPFSVTAHGQDFMADLGNDDFLQEICEEAEFVAVETEYSRGLMQVRCPKAASKIHRVYNGMDLGNFLDASPNHGPGAPVEILSVGRLVAFKGFEYLIEACEQLRQRSIHFRCEIVGDGPLREKLEHHIAELRLGEQVTLSGALPQDCVLERVQRCDIFALASTTDDNGASDIFPDGDSGGDGFGPPRCIDDPRGDSRVHRGQGNRIAGPSRRERALCRRARNTLPRRGPANALMARRPGRGWNSISNRDHDPSVDRIVDDKAAGQGRDGFECCSTGPADCLPDRPVARRQLPSLETELGEVAKRTAEVRAFVCEFDRGHRLSPAQKRTALQLEFLPDAMAIEAEWQANRELVLALEDDRANESQRAPVDLFLRQARFAVMLQRMFARRKICHVHATSSRALICGALLKKILGVSLSASIEARPLAPREAIENGLQHAVGGRIADRKLSEHLGPPFFFDRPASNAAWVRSLRWLKPVSRIDLTRSASFWQEWVNRLNHWSGGA